MTERESNVAGDGRRGEAACRAAAQDIPVRGRGVRKHVGDGEEGDDERRSAASAMRKGAAKLVAIFVAEPAGVEEEQGAIPTHCRCGEWDLRAKL